MTRGRGIGLRAENAFPVRQPEGSAPRQRIQQPTNYPSYRPAAVPPNGRYAFRGRIRDPWHGAMLDPHFQRTRDVQRDGGQIARPVATTGRGWQGERRCRSKPAPEAPELRPGILPPSRAFPGHRRSSLRETWGNAPATPDLDGFTMIWPRGPMSRAP